MLLNFRQCNETLDQDKNRMKTKAWGLGTINKRIGVLSDEWNQRYDLIGVEHTEIKKTLGYDPLKPLDIN